MTWKEIYQKTLKRICEDDISNYDDIVEVDFSSIEDKLIPNTNAKDNCVFGMMLNDEATNEDYKTFCELVYNYVGLDIYDYLDRSSINVFGKKFEY